MRMPSFRKTLDHGCQERDPPDGDHPQKLQGVGNAASRTSYVSLFTHAPYSWRASSSWSAYHVVPFNEGTGHKENACQQHQVEEWVGEKSASPYKHIHGVVQEDTGSYDHSPDEGPSPGNQHSNAGSHKESCHHRLDGAHREPIESACANQEQKNYTNQEY